MYFEDIQKMYLFSFVRELGSFHVVNLCPNTNDFVMKSHILVWQNDKMCFQWKIENEITTGTELSVTIS